MTTSNPTEKTGGWPQGLGARADWAPFLDRYRVGEYRATVFRDVILADLDRLRSVSGETTVLDIGCGRGFDDDPNIQSALAAAAGRYLGVEPDTDAEPGPFFEAVHRCRLEDADIPAGSVDLAFAVMVLEHLNSPQAFWDTLHRILRDGGVFWGFTMNARHWFVAASLLAKTLHLKDQYLDRLHGGRGRERYENYPVYYRSNTAGQVGRLTQRFRRRDVLSFHRIGQLDYYFPPRMRPVGRLLDRLPGVTGRPMGSILAVRVEK
jgi:SAM-dependent methyltransferase